MKVLLSAINAKYIHSNLAVYSLKAYAQKQNIKQNNVEIEILEYTINHYAEDILQDIYKKKADICAFSCYIWNIDLVFTLTKELHKLRPDMPIWLGGPEVSYDAVSVLAEHEEIDLVMMGEGEETFAELLAMVSGQSKKKEEITGIAFRDDQGEIRVNAFRQPLDMNQLPFIYTEEDLSRFENKILYYETSRGCPFSCSYCLSSIERKVRFRSWEQVQQELQFFLDHRVKQVKFVDRTFNCNPTHARNIWSYLTEHDNGVTNFHFEVSADLLKEEDLKLFSKMRAGLIQLEIGVQSTYEPTIQEIDRTMDLERLKVVVDTIHSYENIHQHLDLIVGLPKENYIQFIQSFNDVHAMKPDQLQLGFLKVLKGSKMYRMQKEYGLSYWDKPPYEVLFTNWINYDEILELKGVEEMVEVYYNSSQFVYTLRYLLHFFENPYDFYKALSDYYKREGLHLLKHNRLARYEILMKFALEFIKEPKFEKRALEELMIFDLYLRENVKKRPSWAVDQSRWKKLYQPYYRENKTAHIELFHQDPRKTAENGISVEKEMHILFDYQERNPLNDDAQVQEIFFHDRNI